MNPELTYFFLVVNRYYNTKYENEKLADQEAERRMQENETKFQNLTDNERDYLFPKTENKDNKNVVIEFSLKKI